jgi:hypothetical protein
MSIQQVGRGMLIPHLQMQKDEEENIAFLDPITYEPFNEKLVIDPCGHSYNIETIEQLLINTPDGQPLICPQSKLVIKTSLLAKNRLAWDLLEQHKSDKELIKQNNVNLNKLLTCHKAISLQVLEWKSTSSALSSCALKLHNKYEKSKTELKESQSKIQHLECENSQLLVDTLVLKTKNYSLSIANKKMIEETIG